MKTNLTSQIALGILVIILFSMEVLKLVIPVA